MFNIPFVYRREVLPSLPSFSGGGVNAILWVDAAQQAFSDYGYTNAPLNSIVKQWNDLSPYGNNLTADTASAPLLHTISFSPYGSSSQFPYVEFYDGGSQPDHFAANRSSSLLSITTGFTIFIVMKRNTNTSWSSGAPIIEWTDDWTGESSGFGIDADSSPTELRMWYHNLSSNNTNVYVPWTATESQKFYYYTFRMGGGYCNSYLGSSLSQSSPIAGSNKTMQVPGTTAKFRIAGAYDGGTYKQASPIDVTEVILYNGAVPDNGLPVVWNYLRAKYGFIH